MRADLNADMGESYGPWRMGDDTALMGVITSANIACCGHAGDPDVLAQTLRMAADNGVGIGAHPGFADRMGFGRNRISMPRSSLCNMIRYQVAAIVGMARAQGAHVRHLKLHGALSNMSSEDGDLARDCYEAALSVAPDLIVMVLAGTPQEAAVRSLGCAWAGEVFADRAYNDDATLVDRREEGAVLTDAAAAGARIAQMLREGAIIARSGKRIPAAIDTICVHGDTPGAVDAAKSVRAALEADGIAMQQFDGRR